MKNKIIYSTIDQNIIIPAINYSSMTGLVKIVEFDLNEYSEENKGKYHKIILLKCENSKEIIYEEIYKEKLRLCRLMKIIKNENIKYIDCVFPKYSETTDNFKELAIVCFNRVVNDVFEMFILLSFYPWCKAIESTK